LWRARGGAHCRYTGPVRFRIVGLYVAGRRVQRFFSSAAEAKTFIEAQTVRQGKLGGACCLCVITYGGGCLGM
jgi:hypothetical protein